MSGDDGTLSGERAGDGGRGRAPAPISLSVADDLARKRLTVLFRLLLVIPHGFWLFLWGLAALLAGVANWIATLVTGRPPEALHRFLASYVKYATQVYAYLLLAADPYPPFDGRPGYPIDLEFAPVESQRRLTVVFRLLFLVPVVLVVGALFGLPFFSYRNSGGVGTFNTSNFGLAHVAAIVGWFACLVLRRMPRGLRDAVAWGVGYAAQAWAYALVLTDRYPDLDPERVLGGLPARQDPVALAAADDSRRSRVTVFFRLPLTVPHLVWLVLWGVLAFLAAIVSWFATLIGGRTPGPLHRFLAAYVRYATHVVAFLTLVANPFPGFVGQPGSYPVEALIAEPSRQPRAKTAARLLLAIPAWLLASAYGSVLDLCAVLGWFAALATGRMPKQLAAGGAQSLRYIVAFYGYVFLLSDAYPYSGPVRLGEATPPGAGSGGGEDAPPAPGAARAFG